jgi:hypothetical protein
MFLPDNRYKEQFNDDEWILEQLAKLPHVWRQGTIKKYSTMYLSGGRAAANTWLRESARDFGVK